jgi:hypothetical protein
MKFVKNHNMTKDVAKATIERLASSLMQQFGGGVTDPRYAWHADVMQFSGRKVVFNVAGTLEVSDAELILDVDGIPFFAAGKVRSEIERWFDENWPP